MLLNLLILSFPDFLVPVISIYASFMLPLFILNSLQLIIMRLWNHRRHFITCNTWGELKVSRWWVSHSHFNLRFIIAMTHFIPFAHVYRILAHSFTTLRVHSDPLLHERGWQPVCVHYVGVSSGSLWRPIPWRYYRVPSYLPRARVIWGRLPLELKVQRICRQLPCGVLPWFAFLSHDEGLGKRHSLGDWLLSEWMLLWKGQEFLEFLLFFVDQDSLSFVHYVRIIFSICHSCHHAFNQTLLRLLDLLCHYHATLLSIKHQVVFWAMGRWRIPFFRVLRNCFQLFHILNLFGFNH